MALLYATIGFGGGSSYIAMLAVTDTPYLLIPKISLICNLLVVTGGCYYYIKGKYFSKKFILPFVVTSVPMAFIGGYFPLSEKTFFILLTISLIFCGIRILCISDISPKEITPPRTVVAVIVGGILGLLSGMVGIGGGIFLSPILINMRWARSKEAAAVASMFILLNSLAGLAGQFAKEINFPNVQAYLPLFIAVVIGGQIGSRIGTHSKITYALIQKGTGILTLFISVRLLIKFL